MTGRARRRPTHQAADVLVRIRGARPQLTTSELRVADHALSDPGSSAQLTVTALAAAAGTSQATVVRFAKRLGYAGYPALRLALAAAAAAERASTPDTVPGTDITADDDVATVIVKVARLNSTAVRDTAAQLDPQVLAAVAQAIAVAPRVDIYGLGASAIVAQDLHMKLNRIGRFSQVWSDHHLALVSASLLERRDVAIAISHSGATSETLDALRLAGERKAITVAVTNFPESELATLSRFTLTTAARETALRSAAIASRIAALTVIDCLFETVALRDVPATRRALQRTHDVVSRRGT